MINLKDALTSSVGRKILNALAAIGLVVFVILHLAGNLTLIAGQQAFNDYAAKLHALGPFLYVLEAGLLFVIILHVVTSVQLWAKNSTSRSREYEYSQQSKEGPSNYSLSSTNMIASGLILLAFLVLHILQFRLRYLWDAQYTPENYYKNLYTMVETAFANPVWVGVYCGAMVFLGFHLRHGVWSMFQSIGAMNSRWKSSVYGLALIVALLLAVGFFILPLGIYLGFFPLG